MSGFDAVRGKLESALSRLEAALEARAPLPPASDALSDGPSYDEAALRMECDGLREELQVLELVHDALTSEHRNLQAEHAALKGLMEGMSGKVDGAMDELRAALEE